jgi:hypothetical protein
MASSDIAAEYRKAANRLEGELHVSIPLHVKLDMNGKEIAQVVNQVNREHATSR